MSLTGAGPGNRLHREADSLAFAVQHPSGYPCLPLALGSYTGNWSVIDENWVPYRNWCVECQEAESKGKP